MENPLKNVLSVSKPNVVGPVTVGHGVNEFLSIVIPPIIPLLVADFGITYGEAGFLLTIFFVMYFLFQLPAGVVADKIGKVPMMIVGLCGMSLGIFVASIADSYGMLLAAQSIAGISGSTFHPTGMSLISDAETMGTEGKAMGVFGFGGALGTMSSPLVVGGLAMVSGWRLALAGAAVLGVVGTLASVPFLVRSQEGKNEKKQTNGGHSLSLRRQVQSLTKMGRILFQRDIILLFFATLVLSLQHRAIQTFTTSYVSAELNVSVSVGNLTFFTLLVGGSIGSLWAGDLADKFSRELLGAVAAVATATLVGGTLLVTHLSEGLPLTMIMAILGLWFAVMGVMMYASYPVKNAIVSEKAEAEYSGSLFGIIQTASAIGSATGPALFGAIATQRGVIFAFPTIAGVSVVLAVLFILLHRID